MTRYYSGTSVKDTVTPKKDFFKKALRVSILYQFISLYLILSSYEAIWQKACRSSGVIRRHLDAMEVVVKICPLKNWQAGQSTHHLAHVLLISQLLSAQGARLRRVISPSAYLPRGCCGPPQWPYCRWKIPQIGPSMHSFWTDLGHSWFQIQHFRKWTREGPRLLAQSHPLGQCGISTTPSQSHCSSSYGGQ